MRLASAGRSALVLLLALAAVTSASGSAAQEPSRFEQALAAAERALERGELESARAEVQRALERDGKSARAWELCARVAAKAGARDEEIYSRHRELELVTAQDPASAAIAGRRAALIALDPQAEMLFGLRAGLIAELEPLAAEYEKGGRAHSAIGVHREILALAPHLIHRHADGTEEWMAFFEDPDARPMAIMMQAGV